MLKQSFIALALAAAVPVCFAQSSGTTSSPGSALGSSSPQTQIPSTGAILRPGDTRLPGSDTTPGLSTLPGVTDPMERNSSLGGSSLPGAGRLPASPGSQITPGVFGPAPGAGRPVGPCMPGSISNPC